MRDLEKVIKYWDEEDLETVTYCKRLMEILMRGIDLPAVNNQRNTLVY